MCVIMNGKAKQTWGIDTDSMCMHMDACICSDDYFKDLGKVQVIRDIISY